MHDAIVSAPPAINEPILGYAPGSPERTRLKAALAAVESEVVEVPCVVGGERVRTGKIREVVMPHRHKHVIARFHAATEEGETTLVGDHVLLMAYAHVAHNCRLGNHVILANAVNLAGHVRVDEYAILGGLTPVHQFVAIGCHAFVGGGSRVPQDVPPYVKAAGNPLRACGLNAIGMDRRGIPAEVRLELKRAYRILYRSQLNVSQALDRIQGELKPYPEVHEFVEFVRSSERGIVR